MKSARKTSEVFVVRLISRRILRPEGSILPSPGVGRGHQVDVHGHRHVVALRGQSSYGQVAALAAISASREPIWRAVNVSKDRETAPATPRTRNQKPSP